MKGVRRPAVLRHWVCVGTSFEKHSDDLNMTLKHSEVNRRHAILLRLVRANLARPDFFLLSNACATLANLAQRCDAVHPYVAQRLVAVFSSLWRRHRRLSDARISDAVMQTIEDMIKMVLDVTTEFISPADRARSNLTLVYALLHRRDLQHQQRTA